MNLPLLLMKRMPLQVVLIMWDFVVDHEIEKHLLRAVHSNFILTTEASYHRVITWWSFYQSSFLRVVSQLLGMPQQNLA